MKQISIKDNHLRMINYDLIGADLAGVKLHPQKQMKNLGINLIASVPEPIGDCWLCLTDYEKELPEYIHEVNLKPHSSYWKDACGIEITE